MLRIGIYTMLTSVGLVPVVRQVVDGGRWGAGPSIGFLLVLFGAVGLLGGVRRPRPPTAEPPTTSASPGAEQTFE